MKTLFFIPELKGDLPDFGSLSSVHIVRTEKSSIDALAKNVVLEYGQDNPNLDKILQNEVVRKLGWSCDGIIECMGDKDACVIIANNSMPKSEKEIELIQKNFNVVFVKDATVMSFKGTPFEDKNEDFTKGLAGSIIKAKDGLYMFFASSYDDVFNYIKEGKYRNTDEISESIPFFAALFTSLGIPLVGPEWSQGTVGSQEADKLKS